MGWSSGTDLGLRAIAAIQPRVADEATRRAIYVDIIEAMTDLDWDTWPETRGVDPAWDEALAIVTGSR